MRALEIGLTVYLVLCFGDRLRQISWRSAKPMFVALYLSHMLWALTLLYDASTSTLDAHQAAGILAMLALLQITRPNWANGAPAGFLLGRENTPQPPAL